jgi:hypothetical protein
MASRDVQELLFDDPKKRRRIPRLPANADGIMKDSISFIQSPVLNPAGKELGKPKNYLTYLAFMGIAHLGHIRGSPGL